MSPGHLAPPRRVHLYLDEAERTRSDHGLFLVGGLTVPRPIGWTDHAWYGEILKHPHAAEGDPRRRGSDQMVGRPAWPALAQGGLPGARLCILGGIWRDVDGTREPRKWDVAVAGLLARIIIRDRLTARDTLHVYPDRSGPSTADLRGRLEALGAALRWLLPTGVAPELEVEAWPKDPNHLVGVGLVDLVLYNLGRRLDGHVGDWVTAAREAVALMGMERTVEVVETPPLHDPGGIPLLMRLESGHLDRVDWTRLLQASPADVDQIISRGLSALDPSKRARAISAALDGIGPFAEDAGLAHRSGIDLEAVLEVLRALAVAAGQLGDTGHAIARRHRYLAARTWSHLGRPDRASEDWARWDRGFPNGPVTPELFDELLHGLSARLVFLADLELWEEVEVQAAEALHLVDQYLGAFERVPVRGKLLGALAQARILSRRDLHTVPDLLDRSAAEFDGPGDWSYAWTWRLVGLGRGMPCEDPVALVQAVLERAAEAGWGLPSLPNRFLLWGLAEALARPGLAEALPAERRAVGEAISRLLPPEATPERLTDADRLLLRAWGRVTGQATWFEQAGQGVAPSVTSLRDGMLLPRIQLRTLGAWLAATGASDPARRAALATRIALGTELHLLLPHDTLAGVREAVEGFLAFDLADPAAAQAWLDRGGW